MLTEGEDTSGHGCGRVTTTAEWRAASSASQCGASVSFHPTIEDALTMGVDVEDRTQVKKVLRTTWAE